MPTVINAAYYSNQFPDGREPDLEGQFKQPPINPVEGGLHDHIPIIKTIQGDKEYVAAFKSVFNSTQPDKINIMATESTEGHGKITSKTFFYSVLFCRFRGHQVNELCRRESRCL